MDVFPEEGRLVRDAREGDADALDALMRKYKNLVKARAAAYFLTGGDREDLIQEGMIGLFKAIRGFDPDKS
ncbi:MAG: RNA polymerase sporulation sigma factor SigH, partial [Clostridiales bacterium]|nr:RNA polymerase sporulation sigma factor SigH [Clostridiales bacterium]